MLGGNFEQFKNNVTTHQIPAIGLLVTLAFALGLIFLLYVLGKQSTPMNLLLLFLVGISGIFTGYLMFNSEA
jgi:hypothetical protein